MRGAPSLKQMRYVEAAGRLGSIAAAAEALNISKSSITAAVDALEAELEFDIFDRIPAKGIEETPSGAKVLQLISRFLADYGNFQTELFAVGGTITGQLKLACFPTTAAAFLPTAIQRFQREFPNVRFGLIDGDMDTVVDYLDSKDADIAFTYEEVTSSSHHFELMVELPHYALVHDQDPLAQQSSVRLAELTDKSMISLELYRSGSYYSNLFSTSGLSVNVVYTSSSVEMIRTLIASGFGFTILNARPVEPAVLPSGCRVLPISDPIAPRRFGIVTRKRVVAPQTVQRFVEHCRTLRVEGLFETLAVRKV